MFSASSSCLISRIWSSTSRMVKSGFSPTSSAWRRRIFTPIEWKVPSHGMPSTAWPTIVADALLHLARRLVGEGDGQDLATAAPGRWRGCGRCAWSARASCRCRRRPAPAPGRRASRPPGRCSGIEVGEIAGARRAPPCARAAMPPGAGCGRFDRARIGFLRDQPSDRLAKTDLRESWIENGTRGAGFARGAHPQPSFRGRAISAFTRAFDALRSTGGHSGIAGTRRGKNRAACRRRHSEAMGMRHPALEQTPTSEKKIGHCP